MNRHFQALMADATRLTGQGDLQAATAAIQAALRHAAAAPHGTRPAPAGDGDPVDVIDVDAIEVVDAGDGAGHRTRPAARDRGDPRPAPPPPAPATGRTVSGHHAEAQGGRDYRLFVPPQAGTRPLPLVVMLHGCTQDADDFAAGTVMNEAAREQGFFVLYPEQAAQANPQRCWNWFKHNHQQRGRGEPALLAGMVRAVLAQHAIDADRVYVAGLSAGGAMAAILGHAYPDLFAAVGVHSGLAAGAATDLPGALAAMRQGGAGGREAAVDAHGMPTIVFHGDADATVHPSNGHHVIAASHGAAARGEVRHERVHKAGERPSTRQVHHAGDGRVVAEHWQVHGAAHAWSGGARHGSHTDPSGPDATKEMVRFFFEHTRRAPAH